MVVVFHHNTASLQSLGLDVYMLLYILYKCVYIILHTSHSNNTQSISLRPIEIPRVKWNDSNNLFASVFQTISTCVRIWEPGKKEGSKTLFAGSFVLKDRKNHFKWLAVCFCMVSTIKLRAVLLAADIAAGWFQTLWDDIISVGRFYIYTIDFTSFSLLAVTETHSGSFRLFISFTMNFSCGGMGICSRLFL